MMDPYFGNDSLEPFESIFIGSTELAMAFIWLHRPCECGGYQHTFHITVPVVFDGKVLWQPCYSGGLLASSESQHRSLL